MADRHQFTLVALLALVGFLAVLCGAFVNAYTHVAYDIRCTVMPRTDDALRAWLLDHERAQEISIHRGDGVVSVNYCMRPGEAAWELPPLRKLGYKELLMMTHSYRRESLWQGGWRMIKGIPVPLKIAAASMLGLWFCRRTWRKYLAKQPAPAEHAP